ncbi:MAG: hypothetical protein FJ284_06920 [Planctomycetes bacterium]|nr:hypothetical protein [Planctomycetota bacterium]
MTLTLVAAGMAAAPSWAEAQMGQMGMAPTGGIVNRAVGSIQGLNVNGPGWLYYGINAADRGLGYNGSYMTLGGFIPYAEDDMGGFWAADLRGHLSEYGGFFSNLGAVRKQFLGGTLLGVGVYWDYDGDMNQYPVMGVAGAQFGQFGHTYNQVGISGEWLTDYGNLRSNGYIPVGSTGYTAGGPNYPFFQNFIMCDYGLDAALAGADLEVGVYVPALADWAGMISVGGYALGNSRYDWQAGPAAGEDIVPWFGGVYTRLDMTFAQNWDFSLQYNNDSYFDSTGFARLTYRMGGSRRRNVPDQVEQPMMRNEHIVRAHQTPIVALNPDNGNQPWRVIHVNNAAAAGGDGTAARPFDTLAGGDAAATSPWDIVFVDRGTGTPVGYDTPFSFNEANQFLIGDGQPFLLNTSTCGLLNIATNSSGARPKLSNPSGASIVIDGSLAPGAVVSSLDITGSTTGIYTTGSLSSGNSRGGPNTPISYASPTGDTVVTNVSITGTGSGQTGVFLDGGSSGTGIPGATPLDGGIRFFNTAVTATTLFGVRVSGDSTSNFRADYSGTIATSAAENVLLVDGMTGGRVNIAVGTAPGGSTVPNAVTATGGGGIRLLANSSDTTVNIGNVSLVKTAGNAIEVQRDQATTVIRADNGQGIIRATAGAAVAVAEGSPRLTYDGPIVNAREPVALTAPIVGTLPPPVPVPVPPPPPVPLIPPGSQWFNSAQVGQSVEYLDATGAVVGTGAIASIDPVTGAVGLTPAITTATTQLRRAGVSPNPSYLLSVTDVLSPGEITLLSPPGNPFTDAGDGIFVADLAAGTKVKVIGANITSVGANGILVNRSAGEVDFRRITITGASTAGVALLQSEGGLDAKFQQLSISLSRQSATGFLASTTTGAGYGILVDGPGNAISTASTSQPAVSIEASGANGLPLLDMLFGNVASAVTSGGNDAMLFGPGASGTFTVSGAFTVGGSPGTVAADVTPGGATVIVPAP